MEIIETTEDFVHGTLLSVFVDDLIFEECINIMWCIRTNGCTLDEIYNVEPIDSYFAQEKQNGSNSHSSAGGATVICPVCSETVSGRRFAPHLEKCMNGGKRGTKRHYDYLHDEVVSKSIAKTKSAEVLDPPDLHPTSLIVRIKLRNGVPRPNQKRLGASSQDFVQS